MDLHIPGLPDNMRLPRHLGAVKLVESDVFNICKRIKDIDRNLYIVVQDGHKYPFVVMENCSDGSQSIVSRYERLDSTILTDLQRMLSIPFQERYKRLAARIDKENEQNEYKWMETEQHEEFMYNMHKALVESNLSDPMHFHSYRKMKRNGRPDVR